MMVNLEALLRGKLWVEILDSLPTYTNKDAGRLLIDKSTDMIYFGGNQNWRCLGLYKDAVKKQYIYFNVDPNSEGVNASIIPAYFEGNSTDIQTAIEYLTDFIYDLRDGTAIKDNAIKSRHVDFLAGDIPIRDINGYFGKLPYTLTIEDALTILCQRRANDVLLAKNGSFGNLLGIGSNDVQGALNNIEKYLKALNAEKIPAKSCDVKVKDKSMCTGTNVQTAISNFCTYLNTLRLKDLYDVEDHYGTCHQVLHTCGYDSYCCNNKDEYLQCYWDYVNSSYVTFVATNDCFRQPKGPGSGGIKRETNVQTALNELFSRHIIPGLCDTPADYGPGGQTLVSNGSNKFNYYNYTILGLLDTPDSYQSKKGLKCDGSKMNWAPYIEKYIDLIDGPSDYGRTGDFLCSTGSSVIWDGPPSFIDGVNYGFTTTVQLTYSGATMAAILSGYVYYPEMEVKSIMVMTWGWDISGYFSNEVAFGTTQFEVYQMTSTMAEIHATIGSFLNAFENVQASTITLNVLVLGKK